MKNFYVFIIGLFLLTMSATSLLAQAPETQFENTLQLNISNTTGYPGFFGTCSGEIHPGGKTLCNTPQPIDKGQNMILVPPYPKSYPVFSTDGNNYFSCATLQAPTQQLFFSPQDIQSNTLLLESLIPDSQGNNVSVLCGLESQS